MKCENICVYSGRNEKYFHKEVKSVPTHIKRNFRDRMVQIHFHLKIPSSSNLQFKDSLPVIRRLIIIRRFG